MSETTAAYQYANKATRAKRAKIIEIVQLNPKITGAEIIRQYHAVEVIDPGNRRRTRNMIQYLCAERQLKYLEGDRYIVPN
jgi:hypothetical protein